MRGSTETGPHGRQQVSLWGTIGRKLSDEIGGGGNLHEATRNRAGRGSTDEPLLIAGRPSTSAIGLGFLFGALSFCQGIGEPTDGLASQPSWAILKRLGRSPGEMGSFAALVALPWCLKPVFGLLTDFVPLFGRRRQGYLILAGASAALCMAGLAIFPGATTGRSAGLLAGLAASTLAWSLADVAADALLIDRGRGSGRVGRFQAIQWASAYAAGLIAGAGGGWLSSPGRETLAFGACAIAAAGTLLLATFGVREPPASGPAPEPRAAFKTLREAARSPELLRVGAFLFLWNFNPFSSNVLYLHLTGTLGLDEASYGRTQSLMAVGSIVGCAAYPVLSRRVSEPRLVRLSVVLGVASTVALGVVHDRISAALASLVVGFLYMIATLIQLELAARACPPGAAGTVFASLMALENLASSTSTALGGWCYQEGTAHWGEMASFRVLVAVGAAFTAASWLILPAIGSSLGSSRQGKRDRNFEEGLGPDDRPFGGE